MFRKICIFVLLAISFQNGECKEEGPGYFSSLTDIPFNIVDVPLAAAKDAVYNAMNFASKFTERVSGSFGKVSNKFLNYAREFAENSIDTIRSVVKSLQNAKEEIIQTLGDIHIDVSSAKNEILEKFQHFRDNILKGAIQTSHEFLKNCTQAAKIQIENALHSGEIALEKASELASEFIKEAEEKVDSTKVAVLEKISEELERLKEEYKEIKQQILKKLNKLSEELKSDKDNESIEKYQQNLEEYFEKIKSVLNDGSQLASKVKHQIEELIQAGEEIFENLSVNLQAKVAYIQQQLEEFAKKAAAFREEVIASAQESIESLVNKSNGFISSFFSSLSESFSKGISHLKELFNSTVSLVGDFFKNRLPHVSEVQENAENAVSELDEKKSSSVEDLKNIADNFSQKTRTYSAEDQGSDVHFAGDTLENVSSAFKKILEKINDIAASGKAAVENVFEKSLELYKESKAQIAAAVSDDIEYLEKKSEEVKRYLQDLGSEIGAKIKEAKDKFESFLSKTLENIRAGVTERFNAVVEQVKKGISSGKELFYKISKKLEQLQEQAKEALEDYKAQISVEISEAVEQIQAKAEEVKRYIETKFIQGSQKCVECLKQHKDAIPSLLSDLTKELNSCGGEGFELARETIKESLNFDELSPKLDKISEEYKECKKNSWFGSVTCLGKLSLDENLGLSKILNEISDGMAHAAKSVSTCTQGGLEKAANSFSDLRADIDKCLA